MSRRFVVEPTPAAARKIVRLQALMPGTVIDPAIAALAEQGRVDPYSESMAGLTRQGIELVQDLLDFDLRAVVALSNKIVIQADIERWLRPVLRAAHMRGVTDIVMAGDMPTLAIRKRVEEDGMIFHLLPSSWTVMEEDSGIPRDALLIAPANQDNLAKLNRSVMPLSLEFPRTLLLADPLTANQTRLYPRLPSLMTTFNRRHFDNATTREIAFLFNTSFAISRGL